MFGEKLKKARPPLKPRDHPENDFSEFCDQDQVKQYQRIVGQLIWLTGPIAAGYLQFNWKDGKSNPADILSKHWEYASIWPFLQPPLFWRGDIGEQTKGSDRIFTIKMVLSSVTLMQPLAVTQ